MPLPISDYALIGDTRTAALVGRDGSIDWMCVPRFDSGACFAALVGDDRHGRWLIEPCDKVLAVSRQYRGDTLVLDTTMRTSYGEVLITDLMVPDADLPTLVRQVTGISGMVRLYTELVLRFDYGSVVPWVTRQDDVLHAVAGPDAVAVQTTVSLVGHDLKSTGTFEVSAGESVSFAFVHYPSHESAPAVIDPVAVVESTCQWWESWMSQCHVEGPWAPAIRRSAITLKALTYAPTGGIVAAPTTSLPEQIGGERNWDYRYCWLRDATFTLYALLINGFRSEAKEWREWLLRAAAGRPEDLQILYGIAGERRVDEQSLDWLPGYRGSTPVRVGNSACTQFQLDTLGEVMDVLHLTRTLDKVDPETDAAWQLQLTLLDFLESNWERPDSSLWEVRGPQRAFTHSKVMAWVGFDRAVKAVERHGRSGPVSRWRQLRDTIHADVCQRGFDPARNTFVQSYGSQSLDAALLMVPLVGFLPATDPRVLGTVEAIEGELVSDGLVRRYTPGVELEGVGGSEGFFLPCSFWLADNYALQGRTDEARALFDRLLALRNDVGLLAEEYDPIAREMLGNFPQAFTHVALVNTAHNLSGGPSPAHHRSSDSWRGSTA
ncbi:MAG: glycoside hydrolase family 15 protein [Actinomycetia bacterium]|nr:glycoside hydrolase family 15 protein [Actinomycetes bacterium]